MLLKYITLATAFNFFLLAIVLLLKKAPNKKTNNIVGVFFLMMAIYSTSVSVHYISLIDKHYSLLRYYTPADGLFLLLMGPCIYFYIQSILNKSFEFRKRSMLKHFIPMLPFIAFNIYFATLPYEERINWLIVDFRDGTLENNLLNVVIYIQMIIYLYISYKLIIKQFKVSKQVVINNVLTDISWIKTFVLMNIGFILISAPLCFYLANERANIFIGQLGMNIQFIYIFFNTAFQTNILSGGQTQNSLITNKEAILKIDDRVAEDYLKRLEELMEKQKPYLLEDCNIQTVSEQIGVSVHHLSNILNHKYEKSFPEFVNEHRINEAIKILRSQHGEKITIEAVGFDCGFGSKSSFNKAFKKQTNLTPSEYRKKLSVESTPQS